MRRLIAGMAMAALVGGCQTATVGLVADEKGNVGKVAVLDKKTGAERGELSAADTEAKTGGKKIKAKASKGRFGDIYGKLPSRAVVKELTFETGTTTVTQQSQQTLAELLEVWTKVQKVSDIQIIGYADATGTSADENLKLSIRRAEAVKELLANQGFVFTDDNSEVVGRGDIEAPRGPDGKGIPDENSRRVTVVIR
jgi:outer membrane protein OmpA-like peptidoglycan-associated protein